MKLPEQISKTHRSEPKYTKWCKRQLRRLMRRLCTECGTINRIPGNATIE